MLDRVSLPLHRRPVVLPAVRLQRRAFVVGALVTLLGGCKKPYRVGERVLVEWEEGKFYPAYIIDVHSTTRYRVHFDGYDSRWDEDVGVDKIRGRAEGQVLPPPAPAKVMRASGAPTGSSNASLGNPYHVGERVRVTWRGSVYAATVLEVVGKNQLLVHYDGYESACDEKIPLDRVINRRP
jgi:hypothetical protein